MKVLLMNFTQKEVVKKLIRDGAKILYWVGKEQHFQNARDDKEYFSDTIFHNITDALKATPADKIRDFKFSFPPKEIFRLISDIQYQALEMISRVDFTRQAAFNEKTDLFYQYVIYWYGVLKYFTPDVIIFTDIPHAGPSYVVYSLAKILCIKTVLYRFVKGFPSRLLFFTDFTDYSSLRSAYQEGLDSGVVWEDLSDEMKKYVQKQRQFNKSPNLSHAEHIDKLIKQGVKIPRDLLSWQAIMKNFKQGTLWRGVYNYFFMLGHRRQALAIGERNYSGLELWWLYRKWKKAKQRYCKEYKSLQSEVDFSRKYIYVPLHLQPECNTNPLGGIFDDQILMVRTIAAALPAGWMIYVKENPMQWLHYQGNFGRYDGYYKDLCAIQSVKLVPADTSTFKLTASAQTIATLTGSAGLEALVQLKPVLLFGFGWYMDCDGVLRVDDVVSCQRALHRIEMGYKPEEKKVFAFLQALDKVSIKGAFNKKYSQFSEIPIGEENSNNIANALLKELGVIPT